MRLGEIRVELAHLRHWHAEHLGELDRLCRRLGLVDLIADHHQRHSGFDQELGGARDLIGIGPHPHARVLQFLRDDLGARTFVVEIGMPGDVGGAVRRGPCRLETAPHRFRNHVGAPGEPRVLGDRLDDLLLVGNLLEAVATGTTRLVGAIGIDDERRLLLERVEHLADGIGHADDRRLHDDRRLARGFDVARGHGSAGTLVGGEDVFELRPVDERLVELRILARGIAEHVFHATGDELLGKTGAAGALKRLGADGRGRCGLGCRGRCRSCGGCGGGLRAGAFGIADRGHRGEHRLRGSGGQSRLAQAADESAPRHGVRQILGNQLSHCLLPWAACAWIIAPRASVRIRWRGNRPSI